ncbi:hypothetical protein AVEN_10061-1, partial [Araneus ventricosus]
MKFNFSTTILIWYPEDPPSMSAYCTLNESSGIKSPPAGVVRNFEEVVPPSPSCVNIMSFG